MASKTRNDSERSVKSAKAHDETDRYKHDMAQAIAMRNTRSLPARREVMIEKVDVEDSVDLGLLGLNEADELRERGENVAALRLYELSLELLIAYLRGDGSVDTSNPMNDRESVASRVSMALSEAERLKAIVKSGNQRQPSDDSILLNSSYSRISKLLGTVSRTKTRKTQQISPRSTQSGVKNGRKVASPTAASQSSSVSNSKQRNEMVETVMSDMYVEQSALQKTTWDDIAGQKSAKQSLQEAAILPLLRPDLFTGLRKPQNILLYGPPGTGKTMLVRAAAQESQSALFICTASVMTSKWHGEGEKLVHTLFSVARAHAPAIIFVDEMDALLSARKSDGEHEASRRFKTEFMVNMDGITKEGADQHVLLIACTNCPWDVDSAVMRRFPKRIFVSLPDKSARKALLKSLLEKAGKHSLASKEITKLVGKLDGFSGSDIASIASEAAFGPLRSMGSLSDIRNMKTSDVRPISMKDFEQAIKQATKSVSADILSRYDEFQRQQSAIQ